jgi:hypothetical protein
MATSSPGLPVDSPEAAPSYTMAVSGCVLALPRSASFGDGQEPAKLISAVCGF